MTQYSDILDELSLKLREGDSAAKALYLSEKKNRVLKAENARLYETIDKIQAERLSNEVFIENLTEYNARLLQINSQLRQMVAAEVVPDGQLSFNLETFWEALGEVTNEAMIKGLFK